MEQQASTGAMYRAAAFFGAAVAVLAGAITLAAIGLWGAFVPVLVLAGLLFGLGHGALVSLSREREEECDPTRPTPHEPLQAHIDWLVRKGFRVVSQADSAAQLVRPKVFAFGWAVLWFLLFGVGVVVYVFYYLWKKDDTAYLSVQPDGSVRIT